MNVNSVQSSTFGGQTTPAIHAVRKGYSALVDSSVALRANLKNAPKKYLVSIGDQEFTVSAPKAQPTNGKSINILA